MFFFTDKFIGGEKGEYLSDIEFFSFFSPNQKKEDNDIAKKIKAPIYRF